jgi:hypothetical protein
MNTFSAIAGAFLGGMVVVGVATLPVPASRLDVEPEPLPRCVLQGELAAQTALLAQIAAVLERWDASEQQARDESASRRTRVLHGWGQGQGTQGMRELPTTLGR